MILITTVEEMRQLDSATIEGLGIPSMVLMENAGRGVVDEIVEVTGGVSDLPVTIVCGRGNNGGDGLVVARYLHNMGADVRVFLTHDPRSMRGDAKAQYTFAKKLGIDPEPLTKKAGISKLRRSVGESAVVCDAILGTGARGELSKELGKLVSAMNEGPAFRVAVDAPTGVEMDSGGLMGGAFEADLTVTFGLPKRGHFLYPGHEFCGRLSVIDIGIPRSVMAEADIGLALIEEEDARLILPERPADAHKGTFGTVLIVAGAEGFTGAAVLSGQAALRGGAGLVHLGVPESLNYIIESKVTEVITKPLAETEERSLGIEALPRVRELAKGASCVAIGPGLSRHPETKELVKQLLMDIEKPVVLDADGINVLSDDPEILAKRRWPTVITPHPGELGRLIDESPGAINADRVECARRWAAEWGVVLLLKGAPTVTAHPEGYSLMNSSGNAGMASGGTGDVLTGLIAALISQKVEPFSAAAAGAYFHGLAADVAAADVGEAGLTASDILEYLPLVMTEPEEEEEDHED